jgi:hypothetical protein
MHPYLCPFIWVAGLSIVAEAALPSTAVAAASELALPAEKLTAAAPAACWSLLSYLGARGLSPLQLTGRRHADATSTCAFFSA